MTRDEFKAYVQGAKALAASDPDAYLEHVDATNRPEPVCEPCPCYRCGQCPCDCVGEHCHRCAGRSTCSREAEATEPNKPEVCGFCNGRPVGNAAVWLDGKPRPPAACPRCGETNLPSSSAAQVNPTAARSAPDASTPGVSGSLVRGGDPDPSLEDAA